MGKLRLRISARPISREMSPNFDYKLICLKYPPVLLTIDFNVTRVEQARKGTGACMQKRVGLLDFIAIAKFGQERTVDDANRYV
jgi:hypothetical protein